MSRSSGYRTFLISVRREVLKRDDFQCRVCGRLGPECGGNIDLEAYHMREDPECIYQDYTDNGTTICIPYHHLITRRMTAGDLLFTLDGVAAKVNLLYKDIEALVYLYEHGPATTSEIHETTGSSARTPTIEWLWMLVSVDRDVNSLDGSLTDKDLDTDGWGYPDDIDRTIHGRIPEGEEELVNRLRDELLRWLLGVGVNRSILMLFSGHSRRATFYIARWAETIRVPFDDEPRPDAPMDGDELDRMVDGMERLFRGSDRPR